MGRPGDNEQPALYHADRYETFLGVFVAIVGSFNGGSIVEYAPRLLKADAVIASVERSFSVIPFVFVILHRY